MLKNVVTFLFSHRLHKSLNAFPHAIHHLCVWAQSEHHMGVRVLISIIDCKCCVTGPLMWTSVTWAPQGLFTSSQWLIRLIDSPAGPHRGRLREGSRSVPIVGVLSGGFLRLLLLSVLNTWAAPEGLLRFLIFFISQSRHGGKIPVKDKTFDRMLRRLPIGFVNAIVLLLPHQPALCHAVYNL